MAMCAPHLKPKERWRRYFIKILNLHSEFCEEELGRVRQRPLWPDMAELPEVWDAVGKLRNGKASGASGILHDMVKAASCEEAFMSALMELVHEVWTKCRVPGNWRDGPRVTLAAVTTGMAFRC